MNYNSVQEILSAGTTNMAVLRNNSKQDDDSDTVTGVPWFTYNGTVASTIYASGNSFIGFGSSTEHLKVNRRDCAMWSLYREEGTLYNYYKFLKIRWKGYSQYNQTSSSYAIEYDVILWDTGDISLHMISIPASNNNGTYSLVAGSTYSYTVSTNSPDVTFIKTESGFNIQNNLINFPQLRYLVRDNSNYYTIIDNSLSSVTVTKLTSDVFLNSGTTDMPPLFLLTNLTNPEILFWSENDSVRLTDGLIIQGTPTLPQIIYYDTQDMSNHIGIESVVCLASADALFAISIDEGQTWKYYNGGIWNDVTTDLDGMDANTVHSITSDKWAELVTSSTPYKFRCALPSLTSNVKKIYVKHKEGVI